MQTAARRRTTWAVATSVLFHAVVVVVVALQSPVLHIPPEPPAPPFAVIPVLLVPRTPPAAGQQQPAPIRLHRRPQPFLPPEVRPAPIAPPAPAPGPPAPTPKGPVATFHPAPLPEGPKGDVKSALRHGPVGCANQDAVGLNKAERDLCDQKLGDVRNAPTFATGAEMTADKKRILDAAAAQREADYRYKHDSTSPPPGQGAVPTAGASAEEMCKGLGIPPEKCGVRK
jgi:hypothetical protein